MPPLKAGDTDEERSRVRAWLRACGWLVCIVCGSRVNPRNGSFIRSDD